MLDNGKSPCTVNSFASLAQQGFFNDTPCHRLTTSESLSVLQCGDPTGQGTGGPGYQFANEYPTNQYQPDDPTLETAGGLSARHAGDGQRRARHQRQPVLPGVQGFASCRRTTRCSAPSTRPGWPRWTRSPRAVWPAVGRTASRQRTSRSSRFCWTDPVTTPPPPHGAYPPPYGEYPPVPPGGYPTEYSGYPAGYAGYPQPSRPTRWRSCRWCAPSCSRRWASCSATSRCRRSRRPARRAAGWPSPDWSSATCSPCWPFWSSRSACCSS